MTRHTLLIIAAAFTLAGICLTFFNAILAGVAYGLSNLALWAFIIIESLSMPKP